MNYQRHIGASIEAYKTLGPGMLQSVYEFCLAYILKDSGDFKMLKIFQIFAFIYICIFSSLGNSSEKNSLWESSYQVKFFECNWPIPSKMILIANGFHNHTFNTVGFNDDSKNLRIIFLEKFDNHLDVLRNARYVSDINKELIGSGFIKYTVNTTIGPEIFISKNDKAIRFFGFDDDDIQYALGVCLSSN